MYEQLIGVKIVSPEKLRAYQVMLQEIRAAVNQDHAEVINEREINNTAYYERLRLKWESRYADPADIPEAHATKQSKQKLLTGPKGKKVRR